MNKYTILPKEYLEGDKELEIFEKMGLSAEITEFAIACGGYGSDQKNSSDSTYGWWWTSTPSLYTDGYVDDGYSDYYPSDVFTVGVKGNIFESHVVSTNRGIRPAIDYSTIEDEAVELGKNKYGIKVVEYGMYPQSLQDPTISKELEVLLEKNELPSIEKEGHYPCVVDDHWSGKIYNYNGENYIRVHIVDEDLSSHDDWFKLEPIRWLVDQKTGIAITEKILVAGIPYNDENKLSGIDYDNSTIKDYLNNSFAEDIQLLDAYTIQKDNNIGNKHK